MGTLQARHGKKPIHILGISGPEGQQPVIDAENAKTPEPVDYWGDQRSPIKIGGANKPPDTEPAYIIIENLELRGARKGRSYTDSKDRLKEYTSNAASLYIEKDTISRYVVAHFMTAATALSQAISLEISWWNQLHIRQWQSREHLPPQCLHGVSSHNLSQQPTLRSAPGAKGNNLKDRSAGLKVLNNTIHGENKQLDLVDAEEVPYSVTILNTQKQL